MTSTWIELATAAVGGGSFVKLLDYAYAEYKRRSEASAKAKDVVNRHLDPILKAADELVGKLRSLAEEDFKEFRFLKTTAPQDLHSSVDFGSVLYLFGHFWARVEILRKESLYVQLAADETGARLRDFFNCLESRRVRIVDRAWERAMGESLTNFRDGINDCLSFYEFMERYLESQRIREWFKPLLAFIAATAHTKQRQKLLQFGVVLHALIDTLDSKHMTTRNRPSYANKLTDRTRRDLKFRVFKVYLPFVKGTEKYTVAPTPSRQN